MSTSLSGRNFLKLLDFTSEEILSLVDLAQELKEKKHAGILHKELEGKNIVLLLRRLLPVHAVLLKLLAMI